MNDWLEWDYFLVHLQKIVLWEDFQLLHVTFVLSATSFPTLMQSVLPTSALFTDGRGQQLHIKGQHTPTQTLATALFISLGIKKICVIQAFSNDSRLKSGESSLFR